MEKMTRILILTLVCCILLSVPAFAAEGVSAANITVTVDGTEVQWIDTKPIIDAANRTIAPLRPIANALGLEVEWDGDTRTAIFTGTYNSGIRTVKATIGSKTLVIETSDASGNVTTENLELDTCAVIIDSRTYAPVRCLAEAFGYEVGWDNATRTAMIDTTPAETETLTLPTEQWIFTSLYGGSMHYVEYTYDTCGNLLTESNYYPDYISGETRSDYRYEYTYDAAGNVIREVRKHYGYNAKNTWDLTSYSDYSYDSKGNMTADTYMDYLNGYGHSREYVRNDDGYILSSTDYDADGNIESKTVYDRDSNNYAPRTYVYSGDGTLLCWEDNSQPNITISYNANNEEIYRDVNTKDGNTSSRTRIFSDGTSCKTQELIYDENNKLIHWTEYNTDGKIAFVAEFAYDSEGNEVSNIHTAYNNGEFASRSENTYDSDGNILEAKYVSSDTTYSYRVTYSYDENGKQLTYDYYNYEDIAMQHEERTYNEHGYIESKISNGKYSDGSTWENTYYYEYEYITIEVPVR